MFVCITCLNCMCAYCGIFTERTFEGLRRAWHFSWRTWPLVRAGLSVMESRHESQTMLLNRFASGMMLRCLCK